MGGSATLSDMSLGLRTKRTAGPSAILGVGDGVARNRGSATIHAGLCPATRIVWSTLDNGLGDDMAGAFVDGDGVCIMATTALVDGRGGGGRLRCS